MRLHKGRFSIKLSALLFFASIMLLIYFVCTTKISSYSIQDQFGFASKLNTNYWIGMSLIICALFVLFFSLANDTIWHPRYEKLFLLEVCLLAFYLSATIVLVEENVSLGDSWLHSGSAVSVLIYGKAYQPLSLYAKEYPGVFFFMSVLHQLTQIDLVTLMRLHTAIFSIFQVLISYVLLKRVLTNSVLTSLGSLFFVVGSLWVLPQSFSPSSFAFLWYLLVLYFSFFKGTKKTVALSIFIAFATIISHPTTFPFLMFAVLLIPISLMFASKRRLIRKSVNYYWSPSLAFCILILVAWFGWLIFNASQRMESLTTEVMNFFISLSRFLTFERATQRFQTTPYHFIGQSLKIAYTLLFLTLGFVGTLYLCYNIFKKKQIETAHLFFIALGWGIGSAILGVATLFMQSGEFIERALLFGFIPLTILGVSIYKSRYGRIFLFFSLLIGAPLSLYATYTNQYFEYPSIDNSYGSIFMIEKGINQLGWVKAGMPTRTIYRFHLYYWYYKNDLDPTNRVPNRNVTIFVWSQVSENFYEFYVKGRVYSQLEYEKLRMKWLENWHNMTSQPNFNVIYNNEGVNVGLMQLKENPQ